MSQQSEIAKQHLRSVLNLLEQNSWENISHIEKEVIKRKLTETFDHLFLVTNQMTKHEPIKEVEEALLPPVITEKKEEYQVEKPALINPNYIEQEPVLTVEKVEPEIKTQEPELEKAVDVNLSLPNITVDEDDEKQKASLNERFSKEKTTLADKISRPQGSLKTSIDVNEKFFFIRDLFGADNNAYDKAIRFLDNLSSLDDAMIYIERELAIQYKWEPVSKAREKFMKQVRLRFGQ